MTRFTKIAITVPTATYEAVERVRHQLGKSRSAAVSLALEAWLIELEMSDADRRYAQGYLRKPEVIGEIEAVAAQATSHWDAWLPEAPSRASEGSKRPVRRKHSAR